MTTKPILEHFGREPSRLPLIDFLPKDQPKPTPYDKPRGLWVSVRGDDDWLEWCKSEQFRVPECFQSREIVHLTPEANLLWIADVPALDAFDAEFGAADKELIDLLGDDGMAGIDREKYWRGIDWRKVAARYDGIVIAPYQWERRLSDKCRWYYGWDCASGCIWTPSRAVARLEAIDPPTFEEREEEAA